MELVLEALALGLEGLAAGGERRSIHASHRTPRAALPVGDILLGSTSLATEGG
jgi:hypothetical protein